MCLKFQRQARLLLIYLLMYTCMHIRVCLSIYVFKKSHSAFSISLHMHMCKLICMCMYTCMCLRGVYVCEFVVWRYACLISYVSALRSRIYIHVPYVSHVCIYATHFMCLCTQPSLLSSKSIQNWYDHHHFKLID